MPRNCRTALSAVLALVVACGLADAASAGDRRPIPPTATVLTPEQIAREHLEFSFGERPFRFASGFRWLIENAGNCRQRIVGRVALTHDSASGSNPVGGIGVPVTARIAVVAFE